MENPGRFEPHRQPSRETPPRQGTAQLPRLDAFLNEEPTRLDAFYPLALELTRSLGLVHDRGALYGNLDFSSVTLNPEGFQVRLAEPAESPSAVEAGPCTAPECARGNELVIDARADLYSLGVILYRILTGTLPFDARDPVEWIHCHVARHPVPPRQISSDIPEILSELLLKLLAKSPDDRYQSTAGLQFDLERVRKGEEFFALGTQDLTTRWPVAPHLQSRENERERLLAAYNRVVQTGQPEIVWVSGISGIGKSALLADFERARLAERSVLVCGKFELYSNPAPYGTLVNALQGAVAGILSESDEKIAEWRGRFRAALGTQGRVLTDLIPQLSLVVGPTEELPALPASQARHRFTSAIVRFLEALTEDRGLLTFVIDDLQWIDPGTLEVFECFVRGASNRRWLFVGAYRDDHTTRSSTWKQSLLRIAGDGVAVSALAISPLTQAGVQVWIETALRCEHSASAPLAALVFRKTGGNPLFVSQLLLTLHTEGYIRFEASTSPPRWKWDLAAIEAVNYSDDVAEFVAKKFSRLSTESQSALETAACIGDHVELAKLARLLDVTPGEASRFVGEAIRQGLVAHTARGIRFLHDRIRQTAYQRIPTEARPERHRQIAGRLRAIRATLAERELFEVVGQYRLARGALTNAEERLEVSALALLAGKRAMSAAAYGPAREFLDLSLELSTDPVDIRLPLAQCELVGGDHAKAEMLLREALERAPDDAYRYEAYRLMMDMKCATGAYPEAAALGREALRTLEIDLPPSPSDSDIAAGIGAVYLAMRERGVARIEDLAELPPLTDVRQRSVLKILCSMLTAVYFQDVRLLSVILSRMVCIGIREGWTPESVWAFTLFGQQLVNRKIGRYADGYAFGRLGMALVDRHGLLAVKAKVAIVFGSHISYYTSHLREAGHYLELARQVGLENGDLIFARFASHHLVSLRLLAGAPLAEVWRESVHCRSFIREAKDPNVDALLVIIQRFTRNLMGETAGVLNWDTRDPGLAPLIEGEEAFSEAAFEARFADSPGGKGLGMPLIVCRYHIARMRMRYLFGDFAGAEVDSFHAWEFFEYSMGKLEGTDYFFYAALTSAALYANADEGDKPALLARIAECREQLATWSRFCPANFADRHELVAAEEARIGGRVLEAMDAYDRAIAAAREHGFVHHLALAYEKAAEFYRDSGRSELYSHHLREARRHYVAWGAHGKVRHLDERHGELAGPTSPAESLEILSVVKAAQAISGEMNFPQLVEALMRILVEHAGAERGHLVLEFEGRWTVEYPDCGGAKRRELDSATDLARSVVHYVRHTGEKVILDDARLPSAFSGDEYFASGRARSVLGLPILRQSRLIGVLYLENNLLAHAFTPRRVLALELLAAQAAISIQNARLYQAAQDALRLREEFFQIASHELRTPLTPLKLQLDLVNHLQELEPATTPTQERIRQMLRISQTQIDRLAQLTEDLLDGSRMANDRLVLRRKPVDLAHAVSTVTLFHRAELEGLRCELTVDLQEGVVGNWDSARIDQVITNLLTNAMKYGRGKPILVKVERVPAQGETNPGKMPVARLSIQDHGIGIAPEDQPRIFRRFERAISAQRFGGLGLGLYIVDQIVRAHGGEIRVRSELGSGAKFEIDLPLQS